MKRDLVNRSIDIAKAVAGSRSVGAASPAAAHNARLYLKERLGRLRGLPQKMGQILAMAADEGTAEDFQDLTQGFEPLGADIIIGELERGWGCGLSSVVREFSPIGHPASLGQVHQAVLNDGRQVAVKVRYPGIREAVLNDLKLLGWIALPVGNLNRGFNIEDYRRILLEDLETELDYRKEAVLQQEYAAQSRHLPFLTVPEIVPEWGRENILVASWEEGQSIDEVASTWSVDLRRSLAQRILEHFTDMFFNRGMVHADPHPGNYRFKPVSGGAGIVLYDFGCVFKPEPHERLALLKIIKGGMEYSGDDPYALFLDLGFNRDYLSPIRDKLPALARVLFEPFMADYAVGPAASDRGERVKDILGKHHLNFRMAGPARLVFLMRAFAGLEYYLRRVGVDVMWKPSIRRAMEANRTALAQYEPRHRQDKGVVAFKDMAQHLYVEVRRDGEIKAELIFPVASVDDLEGVMDADIVAKVRARGIELADITRKARAGGYRPMELFQLADERLQLRVWLA